MTFVYHGYKDGQHVATIEDGDFFNECRLFRVATRELLAIRTDVFYCRAVENAKAAWRARNGPGTTWKAQ